MDIALSTLSSLDGLNFNPTSFRSRSYFRNLCKQKLCLLAFRGSRKREKNAVVHGGLHHSNLGCWITTKKGEKET